MERVRTIDLDKPRGVKPHRIEGKAAEVEAALRAAKTRPRSNKANALRNEDVSRLAYDGVAAALFSDGGRV